MKDFAPVTRVGSFTLMLVINPTLPIHSVKDLVDYAKAIPVKLSFASGNTAGIVGGDTLANRAGIKLIHVPYTSTPPALEDIIAGRVSMMFADFTTAMPHVAAGTLRALAVSRIKRSSLFPDLPTMDESGFKGFNLDAWAGLVAPSGTPQSVIDKLNPVLRKIIDSPDVQKKFKNVGFEGFSSTPAGARRLHEGRSSASGRRWSRTPTSRRTEHLVNYATARCSSGRRAAAAVSCRARCWAWTWVNSAPKNTICDE